MGACASTPSASSTHLSSLRNSAQSGEEASSNASSCLTVPSTSESENHNQNQHREHIVAYSSDLAVDVPDASSQDRNVVEFASPTFETHWRCDKGLMWPQNVNYCSNCPKGHSLSICSSLLYCHVCGGDASVCMSCAEGCTYGICAVCLSSLKETHDVEPVDDTENHFLGVRSTFLRAFKTKWGHVTRGLSSRQVCHELVKSLTCRSKGSICEDLKRSGSVDVGQATLVLSHSWCNSFDDTLDAALEVVEEDGSGQLVSD
jgi:hypothetical protein